jgi:hypothetical protein
VAAEAKRRNAMKVRVRKSKDFMLDLFELSR